MNVYNLCKRSLSTLIYCSRKKEYNLVHILNKTVTLSANKITSTLKMSLGFGARAKSVISIIDFTGGSSGSISGASGSNAVVPSRPAVTLEDRPQNPTPDQLELYMPWIFVQWQCLALVAVAKRKQEMYIPASICKKKLEIKIRSTTSKVLGVGDASGFNYDASFTSVIVKTSHVAKRSEVLRKEAEKYLKDTIPIEAFYDSLDHLVRLRISDSPLKLPVELARAFHICFPYQPHLTSLCILNSKLTAHFLVNLGALLPLCHLTEVILDDNYVKEGNYYCLLDEASNLKYLSLKRCRINDAIVSKMIKRLVRGKPAERHFMLLDLTSNNVTDVGAKLFGELLRKNRRISYLNLSGNMITDEGALAILKYLKEFQLTDTEIMDLKQRRMKYFQMRMRTYERLLIEQIRRRQSERIIARKSIARGKPTTPQMQAPQKPLSEVMLVRLNELVGPFVDMYDDNHTIFRDDKYYCTGNFRLAWLNLAYNNISYVTVKELTNVLQYQSGQKKYGDTGLVRVVIEGNYLPLRCDEYSLINLYLNRSLVENVPLMTGKKQLGSISAKRGTK